MSLLLAGAINPLVPVHAETLQKAVLGGGCFWCLEHDMRKVPGVVNAISGYAGGDRPNATYQNYHTLDSTYKIPHIEVVEVTYDTAKVSYDHLLGTFLRHIDPTDNGGQFCDRGPSYRPVIFVANDAERVSATAILKTAATTLKQPVNVDILPAATFWPAEDYHQNYASKNTTRYKFYRWNCGRDQRIKAVWEGK